MSRHGLRIAMVAAFAAVAQAGPALAQTAAGVTPAGPIEPVAAPGASLNPLAHISLDSLTETRAAPLFSPTRAKPEPPPPEPPPEIAAAEAEPEAEEPQPAVEPLLPNPYTLIGVVLGPTRSQALLRDGTTGQVVRLAAGESAGGWTLVTVAPREVEIERDGARETLKLFTGAARPSPPPTPGVPAMPAPIPDSDPGMPATEPPRQQPLPPPEEQRE